MTSQGQTCVDTPILDTLRLSVTHQHRRVRATMRCAELPVNDLGTGPGSARGAPRPSGPDLPAQADAPGPAAPREPPGWPGQFAQVLAETLAGSRPSRQLVPWTT